MQFELSLPPARRVTQLLVAVVFVLISLSVVGQVAKHVYGHTQLKGFVPAFYVDYESSVPTWYSSAALLAAAGLCGLIALAKGRVGDPFRWHWRALATLFCLLSIDEIAMFHEMPIDPLRDSLGAGGMLYYTWVIPGAAFVLVVGLCFLRFLWNLPATTRNLFVLSGMIFVGGAIGVEMVSGAQADAAGEENLRYALIITVEEAMEMLGVVLFIHALTDYIHRTIGPLRLQLGGAAAPTA